MKEDESGYSEHVKEWIDAQLEFIETINALHDLLQFADHSQISHHDAKWRWRKVASSLGSPDGEQRMDEWKRRYHAARNEAFSIENEEERSARDEEITTVFREELEEIMRTSGSRNLMGFSVQQIESRPRTADIIHRSILVSLTSAYEGLMGAMYGVLLKGRPELCISNGNSFSLAEIIRLGTVDAVLEEAISKKVDSALRGGLEDWSAILAKSEINLKECCINWEKALEVFQRRNAHVHTRGKVNSAYKAKVTSSSVEVGHALEINSSYLQSAMTQILSLGCLVAIRAWLAVHPRDAKLVGAVPYMYYDELLERGYWEVVEKVAGSVKNLDFPLDLKFSQRTYYWVARKIGRGSKNIAKDVSQWDTSALKPLFSFEKHVLLGELDEAERLLEAAKRAGAAWADAPLDTPVVQFDKDAAQRLEPLIGPKPETSL